jgi:hypothetical protein
MNTIYKGLGLCLFTVFFFLNSAIFSVFGEEEVEYEADIRVAPVECLGYLGAGRGPGGSYQLNFYNACPDNVYANVCVEERPGKFRLHKSASRIPKYGHLTIFTYEGMPPASVHWRSSSGRPEVPGPCGEETKN